MVEKKFKTERKVEVLVLYASETGNCEQISEDLNDSLKEHLLENRIAGIKA